MFLLCFSASIATVSDEKARMCRLLLVQVVVGLSSRKLLDI